jgi:cytochrome c-type biogenesis protein CcmH
VIGLWVLVGLQAPAFAGVDDAPAAEDVLLQGTDGIIGEPGALVTDEAELEERTRNIGLIIRCPVCQGLSIADSSSDAAVAMSNRIRELLQAGYADQQILDFFADRYGDFILLAPPKEGMHWVLWVGPLLAVGCGLFGLWARSRLVRRVVATTPVSESAGGDDDPYRTRILDELKD